MDLIFNQLKILIKEKRGKYKQKSAGFACTFQSMKICQYVEKMLTLCLKLYNENGKNKVWSGTWDFRKRRIYRLESFKSFIWIFSHVGVHFWDVAIFLQCTSCLRTEETRDPVKWGRENVLGRGNSDVKTQGRGWCIIKSANSMRNLTGNTEQRAVWYVCDQRKP